MLKKLWLLLLFCFTGIYLDAAPLTILNTTDFHGHADGNDRGILKVARLIEQQRQRGPAGTILLIDCGDTIQGTFSSTVFQGRLMLKCLNYLDYDVWVPGNHDFDYGLKVLGQRLREFRGAALAANLDCPYLTGVCGSWKLFTRNGIKIAVIGLTRPGMSSVLIPGPIFRTLAFDAALKRIMPEIRAARPDMIILAQHQGRYGRDFSVYQLAARYPEIDLILGGHTHLDEPGRKIGPNTWYFQAGKHARGLGRIEIEYDRKRRRIIKISSEIIPVTAAAAADEKLSELIRPELQRAEKLGRREIAMAVFKNTAQLDSGLLEQHIIARMMLAETGADIAVCAAYPTKYKLDGAVPVTLKRLYYWSRYNDTVCTLVPDKAAYVQVIAEQRKALRKDCRMVIVYAGKDPFKTRDRAVIAFNSYALTGGGGKFPFLRSIAANRRHGLKNTGIIIRDGLKRYLAGKLLLVTGKPDGQIAVERQSRAAEKAVVR
ncbi:MAG: metallophosphoesterase [Victivallaceae bacterium]|nr:metallophosphoesterase [Victivallaceae bacterium]